MKLNFGSAHDKLGDDWKNVDVLDWDGNTDIIHNMCEFAYPFEDNTIDEIQAGDVIEHITFRLTFHVLREFNRILKPGGKLHIRVPDAGKAMQYYVNGQVCDCVPHKADKGGFIAKENCPICEGKGMINPNRWLFTFTGAQKHPFDTHLNIFTRISMTDELCRAKFTEIEYKDDIYKLKVTCKKSEEE